MAENSFASSRSTGLKPRNVGIIIALIILFIIFWSTFVIVPAGSRGVVLWWGKVENRIMGEGLNFKVPIAETVIKVDVRVQPHPFKEIDASSKEYQIVKMTGMMNFHIDPAYVNDLYQKVGLDFADKVIDPAWLKQNYIQSWLDMATMQGKDGPIMAGVWGRANGKSLVFYPKKAFDAAGYKVPQTWDEMMTLTDQIAKDGDTPWCIGIESGAATGWAMTDWIEDVMLRTTSPENYDKWVKGELKFDSPEVKNALKYVTAIWFNDKYVYGGRKAITTTAFGDAPKPMFQDPPKCWLHRQGNFITTFFPEGLKPGVDYDFFYLPPIDAKYGKPVLGAGDIYAMFSDRPETRAVIQYFSTGDSVKGWAIAGGAISPHKDSSLDWYGDPVTKKVAEILQGATVFRFDGSDLMPGAVGAGSFWKSMTDYVSGSIDEETALKQIDASWPKK